MGSKIIGTEKKELPDGLKKKFKKASRMEWITLFYLVSVVIVIALTMGTSQAMKAAFFDTLISTIPSLGFLVSSRYYNKEANDNFPYGYHRIYSITFLIGAFALFSMGVFICIGSAITLFKAEHANIWTFHVFGQGFWLGWLMILALLYNAVPASFIGRKKLPLALALHNKLLYTDADAQKADWMAAGAAIVGIIGIGFGFWWFDAAAALVIAVNIIKDGFFQLRTAVFDLMDQTPNKVEKAEEQDPLVQELVDFFEGLKWVKDFRLRLREHGHVYFGEVFVIPEGRENLLENIEKAYYNAKKLHWKVHGLVITPIKGF